ncbi:ChrR family anti-sigma-E factor [Vibrio nigripulchritudo]|uniref:ChrR family anti-sigma-E factor n=1 Tax=Vibrio nigripulchritudo TaxID=28173 RepID=UPI0024937407|nr:ChrR family anti-sigma-E factor [Vibrio nigripulchritudo]BDU38237.1 transcriptional regulator [Vibrio nigripulchritudo]BDU43960.1 transcriptional regulator [Vibrio nigripulchritudo]
MSYHPDLEMFKAYVDGTIDPCHGIMVAAHLETSSESRQTVQRLEAEAAQEMFSADMAEIDTDLPEMEDMLSSIMDMKQLKPDTQVQEQPANHHIELNGKKFVLPKALRNHITRIGEWRSYGGKVYSAAVELEEEGARMNLLYIKEGVQVPQHTHKGIETTLVLHGGFTDEHGHYDEGDFMTRDASVKHSPQTPEGQDCLCLTVLTEPMIFTQGVARVFNLFGRGVFP